MNEEQKSLDIRLLGREQRQELIDAFKSADMRLILSDYDGTLVPFKDKPELAKPDERLKDLLKRITCGPKNDLVLISGRNKDTLQEWFGDCRMDLVAEHGGWIKKNAEEWEKQKCLNNSWMAKIRPVLDIYVDNVPGSFVEAKEFSLVWHFRVADPKIASLKAKELMDDLLNFTAGMDVQILPGNKIIEVRNAGINKGEAIRSWLEEEKYDFILALGDDLTDEDLFRALPKYAYSLKVGLNQSLARFNIPDHTNVLDLLEAMIT